MSLESLSGGRSGSGIQPESVRDALVRAFGETAEERMLMRWELERVVAAQVINGQLFELREDGHINRIVDGIVYTTEPFENPTGSRGEQEAWRPYITPGGEILTLRVRGLLL